ncbi:hypothetical protein [Mucilaginibacter sp. UYCu711]|uniref:hypothetical protein n=1 Tax=Mucilaginibacter sp. UYCu711 TaxID=3156339 RepID=UPI003D1A6BD8
MYLIARNKIASYIKQHPEVQTSFLVWLKEFAYREAKRLLKHNSEFSPQLVTTVESQFGNSNYKIRYCINSFLNTAYIDWVGTVDEYREHTEKELANKLALYPDIKVGQFVTRVALTPPDLHKPEKGREVMQPEAATPDQLFEPEMVFKETMDFLLKSTEEYEAGLARAIGMFDAGPSTPEGLALAELIPELIHYENKFIPFAKLDPLTVIKLKMREMGMGSEYPLDLIKLIGSKEDLDQYLSGGKPLSKQALGHLYNYLQIHFMDIDV